MASRSARRFDISERLPADLECLDRLGQALQLELPERRKGMRSCAGRPWPARGRRPGSGRLRPGRTGGPPRSPGRRSSRPPPWSPRRHSAPRAAPEGRSAPALSRSTACCMATAQDRAAEAAGNTTISPSPRFLTSVPPRRRWPGGVPRSACGAARRRLRGRARGQLGRTDQVGEEHRDVLGGGHRPPSLREFLWTG